MKKLLGFLGLLMIVLLGLGCSETAAEGITITSEGNVRNIKVTETLQLTAQVFPEKANQNVKWTSTNTEVATVSEVGLVTAVSVGTVDILATSFVTESVKQTFTIIIEETEEKEVTPTSVKINASATTCKAGEKIVLSAIVDPEEANQAVTLETSDAAVATVNRGEVTGLKEGTVTITCYAKGYTNIFSTVDLTITKGDDPVVTKDWPTMAFCTHEEYMTAEAETPLKIKGIVTYVLPVVENKVTYLIQNGTEGYYVYNQDAINFPVEVGKVYEVGGFKKYFRGLNEIIDVEYFKAIDENITATVNKLENVNTSDLDAMSPFHCSMVTAKAVLKEASVNNEKAYSFYALIGTYETQFRVDPTYMSAEEFANINKKLAVASIGAEFEFTGIMSAFGYGKASPQIQIVNSSDLTFKELSNEELLQAAVGNITIASSVAFSMNEISLPTIIEGFENMTVAWVSDSDLINVETGVVTHGTENTKVTLTAILSYNGKTLEHKFEVLVFAMDNTQYEVVASLDLEDAETGGSYGVSPTKSGYKEGTVTLGTPKATWLLRNALIAGSGSDKFAGVFSIRAQANADAAQTARIEIKEDGLYNVVEFAVAIYGNDNTGIKIRIEYSTDAGTTWLASEDIITVDSRSLETYRIKLPEGNKRVAIVVVEGTGKRVNIDNIKLMK